MDTFSLKGMNIVMLKWGVCVYHRYQSKIFAHCTVSNTVTWKQVNGPRTTHSKTFETMIIPDIYDIIWVVPNINNQRYPRDGELIVLLFGYHEVVMSN